MSDINQILDERGARYGTFAGHAEISQHLKMVVRRYIEKRGKVPADDQAEAMDMICHKIARIINGDLDYVDNWIDIAGYAQLVADRLEGRVR